MAKLTQLFMKFPRAFWISNIMELFERWAWYGFYNAFALYLTLSKDTGALGFTQAQKGIIMGTGTMLLYFLPIITGALADRVGFKKMLVLSFTMYIGGYFMVGYFDTFELVFASYIFLAVAGALFKPVISGMIAKTTDNETASVGFGIFYMMVNIGGFIGPFVAGFLYKVDWNYVFLMSIITIAINYIFVFFYFREPGRDQSSESLMKSVGTAAKNILVTLSDYKYVLFLVIMSFFWTAFNQLYYSFPVFIEHWVDLDGLSALLGLKAGTITAVTVISMDAFFIIVLQLWVSSQSMKLKPLTSIMTGTVILAIGLAFMFITNNPYIILLAVLVFAIGEMASSPKYTEYVGRIAPPDKKALYMGSSFLPYAAGHYGAGWISGRPYEVMADKFYLLQKAVAEKGFSIPDISESFTQSQYYEKAQELFGMDSTQLTTYLWNTYNPQNVWMIYAGLAMTAAILLFAYDKTLMKNNIHNNIKH
jgi:proton-dependent oligopeptide transporter, POT family